MNVSIAIFYGLLISALHFYADNCRRGIGANRERLLSFAAGVSIAYLFLQLLPHIHEATLHLKDLAYISIMLGFASFHLVEKYIYQHAKRKERLMELKEVHSIAFFIYYFIMGSVLYFVSSFNAFAGLLFILPILVHAAVGEISTSSVHESIRNNLSWKLFMSSSTLLGILFFHFMSVPSSVVYVLLGFAVGALFYITIKDLLPQKSGSPSFFIAGATIYSILIFSVRTLLGL